MLGAIEAFFNDLKATVYFQPDEQEYITLQETRLIKKYFQYLNWESNQNLDHEIKLFLRWDGDVVFNLEHAILLEKADFWIKPIVST